MWPGCAGVVGEHGVGAGQRRRRRRPARAPGRGCPARRGRRRAGGGRRRSACASRGRARVGPAACIDSSRWSQPMPKWMPGASGWRAASSANTRRRVRQHEPRRSRPRTSAPAHESNSWKAPAPCVELGVDEGDGDVGEALHQLVPQRLVGVHQRLGVLVVAARAALDQVAGDGERRPGEGQQRHVGGQFRGEQLDGVGDVARCRRGSSGRSRSRSAARAQRVLGDRARCRARRRCRTRRRGPARRCRCTARRRRRRSGAPAAA